MYDSWRGGLYPEGLAKRRWLERYAERFDTVEVDSTFYRLASRDAVARWVEQTPEHFVFAVKASRYLTHMKKLRDMGPGHRALLRAHRAARRGRQARPRGVQLPPTFQRDDEVLDRALGELRGGRHCIEFRHPSWFAPDVCALLREEGWR